MSSASSSSSSLKQKTEETKSLVLPKENEEEEKKKKKEHICNFCSSSFASRNALFRHVRTSCTQVPKSEQENNDTSKTLAVRHSVAFKIAYYTASNKEEEEEDEGKGEIQKSVAEYAGDLLVKSFTATLLDYYNQNNESSSSSSSSVVNIISTSQVSIAKQRHKSLSQEVNCAALGDIVTINYSAPPPSSSVDTTSTTTTKFQQLKQLFDKTKSNLESQNKNNKQKVYVLDCTTLPTSQFLHAEPDCTQRIYHYLMPLSWLPNGTQLQTWWMQNEKGKVVGDTAARAGHTNKFTTRPPVDDLRIVAKVLKSAACDTVSNRKVRRRRQSRKRKYENDAKVVMDNDDDNRKEEGHEKEAETEEVPNPNQKKLASGRYGALANKERKPFHNYADPSLQGYASPNNEPVWRTLDSAKICRFFSYLDDGKEEEEEEEEEIVIADVEFKGDHFLPQQIRRIVGTALAVTHGWLPSTIFEETLDKNVFVETVLAPSDTGGGAGGSRLYMEEGRFHFDQLCRNGKRSLFERTFEDVEENGDENGDGEKDDADGIVNEKKKKTQVQKQQEKERENEVINENYQQEVEWIQKQLLPPTSSSSSSSSITTTTNHQNTKKDHLLDPWLQEVRDVIAPRIQKQLDCYTNIKTTTAPQQHRHQQDDQKVANTETTFRKIETLPSPPDCYNPTLTLLRNIVKEGKWPDTSVARSKVIRNVDNAKDKDNEKKKESSISSGSFTVVNPKRQVGSYQLPMANTLFPDLVKAVFDLEETLAENHTLKQTDGSSKTYNNNNNNNNNKNEENKQNHKKRPSSSHCAINCNAQFTPHVDSGRGSGQSLSMIVGLGDYLGGELAVEGDVRDIRYDPLEFDGWKLRHWTCAYEGERFSLVWFTPAEFSVETDTTTTTTTTATITSTTM